MGFCEDVVGRCVEDVVGLFEEGFLEVVGLEDVEGFCTEELGFEEDVESCCVEVEGFFILSKNDIILCVKMFIFHTKAKRRIIV